MSRPLRIEYPGAWYHVMNRGRRSESIFLGGDDYLSFLRVLEEGSVMWNVRIAAFCLMPNHYHLLLQTPQGKSFSVYESMWMGCTPNASTAHIDSTGPYSEDVTRP